MSGPPNAGAADRARRTLGLALPALLLLGMVAVWCVTLLINARADRADCPPAAQDAVDCLGGIESSSMTLELAGSGKHVACQLHPVARAQAASSPTPAERICIEARVRTRWDELVRLDVPLIMPVYGLFSLLLSAWLALNVKAGRRLLAAAPLAVTTVLLLVLDARENTQALALLIAAERGPLSLPHYAALDAAAAAARQASLLKWAASSLWAFALAWGLIQWRGAARHWRRWLRRIAIAAAILAAVVFAVAVAVALDQAELARAVQMLSAGFVLAFLAMFAVALSVIPTRMAKATNETDSSGLAAAREEQAGSDQLKADDAGREFHLEEYRQLRSEVVGLLARIELLFRSAIVVAATAFAWLVVNSLGVDLGPKELSCLKLPRELLLFAWMIPPAFVLCTGMMAGVTRRRVTEMGAYLHRLEQALGNSSLGWENYLRQQRSVLTPMTQMLWWLLFILTIAATMVALIAVEQAVGACSLKS